jgi:Ca2+-binding RTX toxin-like protein
MRRALLAGCALALLAANIAWAGEVSGRLVFCEGDDICRYFPQPRLDVTFRAAAGERNELRVAPDPNGVRIVDPGAPVQTGDFCTATSPNEVSCGPPAPEGLVVTAFTGDRADTALAGLGILFLGDGPDHGIAEGATIDGGRGDDRLISATGGNLLSGGPGNDHLSGAEADDTLAGEAGRDLVVGLGGADRIEGGPSADRLAGGAGRDEIYAGSGDDVIHAADRDRDLVRCGRGDDRAVVGSRDRTVGCERVVLR